MSLLKNVKIFEALSETEKDNLSMFCQEKTLVTGDVLFEEWDEWNAMYLLTSWEIEISKTMNDENTLLGHVQAEEILWEMAIFWANNKRMAKAVATKNCTLITVLAFSIKDLTNKYPELLEKIQTIIHGRNIDNKIIETSIKN